jgi:hypothetical protein
MCKLKAIVEWEFQIHSGPRHQSIRLSSVICVYCWEKSAALAEFYNHFLLWPFHLASDQHVLKIDELGKCSPTPFAFPDRWEYLWTAAIILWFLLAQPPIFCTPKFDLTTNSRMQRNVHKVCRYYRQLGSLDSRNYWIWLYHGLVVDKKCG